MNKKEFEKWVDSRLKSFAQALPEKRRPWEIMKVKHDEGYSLSHNAYIGNFFITSSLMTRETTIFNTATKHYATAKCRAEDAFSIRVGIAIAWAKYNHEVVPDYTNSIPREELVNGDKFISSVNQNHILVFIGWLPNARNGMTGKWAVALDDNRRPIKTQIAENVIKVE